MDAQAIICGNPPLLILNRGHGETPPCPEAKFHAYRVNTHTHHI